MESSKKIRTDIFEYDKAYSAFKMSTTQNSNGALLSQTLLNKLKDAGYICNDDKPVIIADICCGAGDTIITFLENVNTQGGFEIRGVDANPEYTGYHGTEMVGPAIYNQLSSDKRGIADINYSKAKESQIIPLKNYQVRHADVLKADLSNVLRTQAEIDNNEAPFRLVYFSHCVYYFIGIDDNIREHFVNLIDKICSELLAEDGIIILLHGSFQPNSFASMESKFSFNKLKDVIPTPEEYNELSPDCIIKNACNKLGLSCFEIPHTSPVNFSKYLPEYADVMKDPSRYDELLSNEEAYQDFYRMLFAAHRSPEDLYQDKSSSGLANLVDKTVSIVKADGSILSHANMQVVPSRKASNEFKQKLEAIVKDIVNSKITK